MIFLIPGAIVISGSLLFTFKFIFFSWQIVQLSTFGLLLIWQLWLSYMEVLMWLIWLSSPIGHSQNAVYSVNHFKKTWYSVLPSPLLPCELFTEFCFICPFSPFDHSLILCILLVVHRIWNVLWMAKGRWGRITQNAVCSVNSSQNGQGKKRDGAECKASCTQGVCPALLNASYSWQEKSSV